MQKKYFISFLAVITILLGGIRGEAFVPQTPHLLHLVVKKIRIPEGMTVSQTRRIAAASQAGQEGGAVEMQSLGETLTYGFPDRLRSEIRNGAASRFYALSPAGFVKVENGQVTDLAQAPGEFYTDPLLYRDHDIFAGVLARRGINTSKVTLQRLDGEICWFIGEPAYDGEVMPGLWIGKDSFFPKRYLIRNANRIIDVRYGNWERISRSWYPKEARIFVDGELFAQIVVDRMSLASGLPGSLFDIKGILERYPKRSVENGEQGSGTGHLDKEIDTFNQLYD
ncbi:MAG: hypothetical protein HUN04_05515 [Desulfobacter sp.]|nr:MAG: hypothetical protein HUN04_05515 [Desulfobacter sp.]